MYIKLRLFTTFKHRKAFWDEKPPQNKNRHDELAAPGQGGHGKSSARSNDVGNIENAWRRTITQSVTEAGTHGKRQPLCGVKTPPQPAGLITGNHIALIDGIRYQSRKRARKRSAASSSWRSFSRRAVASASSPQDPLDDSL